MAALVRAPEGGGVSVTAGIVMGVVGGAIRISTPFLFVSLGECLTEKSGREYRVPLRLRPRMTIARGHSSSTVTARNG